MNSVIRRAALGLAMSGLLVASLVVFTTSAGAQQGTEELYNHKCAVCHGKDGLGNTLKGKKVGVKDVRTNMKDSENQMVKVVVDGKGDDMDSYKKEFSSDQIKALVNYYRDLGKKK